MPVSAEAVSIQTVTIPQKEKDQDPVSRTAGPLLYSSFSFLFFPFFFPFYLRNCSASHSVTAPL